MKTDTLFTQKSEQVTIIARRYGDERNILSITCNMYDMSVYVDILRRCVLPDSGIDYLVIEPYKLKDLFSDAAF